MKQIGQNLIPKYTRIFKAALEARNKLAEEAEDKTEKENLKVDYVVPTAGENDQLGEAKMTFYGPLENDYQYGRKVDLNTGQENKYSNRHKDRLRKQLFLNDWRCPERNNREDHREGI